MPYIDFAVAGYTTSITMKQDRSLRSDPAIVTSD